MRLICAYCLAGYHGELSVNGSLQPNEASGRLAWESKVGITRHDVRHPRGFNGT